MRMPRWVCAAVLLLLCALFSSCTGSNKEMKFGIQNSQLPPCPPSPNCISSDTDSADQLVQPFQLAESSAKAWQQAQALVAELPRTKIITANADYLHAECRSAVFGFIDDLELHLRPKEGIIAVRSAARVGYSDFGVNRQRVEALRAALLKRGALHPTRR